MVAPDGSVDGPAVAVLARDLALAGTVAKHLAWTGELTGPGAHARVRQRARELHAALARLSSHPVAAAAAAGDLSRAAERAEGLAAALDDAAASDEAGTHAHARAAALVGSADLASAYARASATDSARRHRRAARRATARAHRRARALSRTLVRLRRRIDGAVGPTLAAYLPAGLGDPPARQTRCLVSVATRLLPAPDRARYREEFHAELADLPRRRQFNHALRVSRTSLRLRHDLRRGPAALAAGDR